MSASFHDRNTPKSRGFPRFSVTLTMAGGGLHRSLSELTVSIQNMLLMQQ